MKAHPLGSLCSKGLFRKESAFRHLLCMVLGQMSLTKLTLVACREPFIPCQATLISHISELISLRYVYSSFQYFIFYTVSVIGNCCSGLNNWLCKAQKVLSLASHTADEWPKERIRSQNQMSAGSSINSSHTRCLFSSIFTSPPNKQQHCTPSQQYTVRSCSSTWKGVN